MTRRGAVRIEELEVACVVGIHEAERTRTQPVVVDCEIVYRQLPTSEAIEEAIDYSAAAELIQRCAVEGRYLLLERLAEEAASQLLARFEAAASVTLSVRKPEALGGNGIPSVRVELYRD